MRNALIWIARVLGVLALSVGGALLALVVFILATTSFGSEDPLIAVRAVLWPFLLVSLGGLALYALRGRTRKGFRMPRHGAMVLALLAVGATQLAPVKGPSLAGVQLWGAPAAACADDGNVLPVLAPQSDDDEYGNGNATKVLWITSANNVAAH